MNCKLNNGQVAVDDNSIMQRIHDRNESGLSDLIAAYGNQVFGMCSLIAVDTSDAEAVTSDVFLEIWNRPTCFDAQRGSLGSFLLTLARSRSLDRLRARRNYQRNLQNYCDATACERLTWGSSPEAGLVETEDQMRIREAVNQLPEDQRNALQLAFFAGLTHREIAERLSIPLGTIKTYIRKGLLHLRNTLADEFELGGCR